MPRTTPAHRRAEFNNVSGLSDITRLPRVVALLVAVAVATGSLLAVDEASARADDASPSTSLSGAPAAETALGTIVLHGPSTITGVPLVGETLTATPAAWTDDVDLSYQWLRDGSAIADATLDTYTTQPADSGHAISVMTTGSLDGYSPVADSSSSVEIGDGILTSTLPKITGTPTVTKKLGLSLGTWSPSGITFSYQWNRNGVAITGATSSTYTLPVSSAGSTITATVKAVKSGYTEVTQTAAGVKPVLMTFTKSPVPTIHGTVQIAHKLSASIGTWSPAGASFSYRWLRSGKAIANATHSTYVLTASDVHKAISVTVTASKSGYTTTSRTSKTVTPPAGKIAKSPTPTISGTAKSGHKLTANVGTWSSGVTVKVQWRRDGKNISGATSRTYTVRSTDVGAALSVVSAGSKAGYTTVSRGSKGKAVAVVAYPNCKALNAVYPHGVARASATYDLVSGSHKTVAAGTYFNTALYDKNPNRDRDKDGIACEKR